MTVPDYFMNDMDSSPISRMWCYSNYFLRSDKRSRIAVKNLKTSYIIIYVRGNEKVYVNEIDFFCLSNKNYKYIKEKQIYKDFNF